VDQSFGHKIQSEQQAIVAELQLHARGAGLAGTVVPVWDSGSGRMGFVAPRNWHPFFKSFNLRLVATNINKEIYW
jgi:hypothetical protein